METTLQNVWAKSKLLVKGLIIGILVLLLQIPAYYVKNLIEEREARQKEAITDVSSKWAGKQNITGPILVLPYWEYEGDSTSKKKLKHYASFLPDELTVNASLTPQEKYRGIYKVMLYNSKVNIAGSFKEVQPEKLNIPMENILWNEAFVRLNIADSKGLNDEPKMNWNSQPLTLSPQVIDAHLVEEGLIAPVAMSSASDLKNIQFSAEVNLNGSEQLLFTPIGKQTTVHLSSQWPHPSFTGSILPQTTQVKDSGFTATWKSLSHKRSFPQQWKDEAFTANQNYNPGSTASPLNIGTAAFGADLFVPVNGYQKTMRSVKYAALCILLTFASFFIIEINNKKSVHPFQYGLIGLALILFYTLLLSFSEYIGFNASYAVASICTIGLIGWFVKGLLSSTRLAALLSTLLVLLYVYVFTILQLQDYSLLLGSVGLFITLAVIMHFSRKIQW
jgi:inner membrane protein